MGIPTRQILRIALIYASLLMLTIIIAGMAGIKISKIYAYESISYIRINSPELYQELQKNASRMGIPVEEYYYKLLLSRISKSDNVVLVGLGMLKMSKLYLKTTPNLNLMRAIGLTLGIMAFSFAMALLIGTLIGLKFRGDKKLDILSRFFNGVPSWWLGVLLILIFVTKLNILSVSDIATGFSIKRYILPITTLTLIYIWEIADLISHEISKEMNKPYIWADKGKGLPDRVILWKHALRNISITLSSFSFYKFGELFTDFMVIDVLFGLGGLGSLLKQSFIRKIVPPYGVIVQFNYHLFFVVAITILTIQLAVSIFLELIKGMLDPRVS